MKIVIIPIIGIMFSVALSCKSKAQKDAQAHMDNIEKAMKENGPQTKDEQSKATTTTPNIPRGMESLMGEWELVKFIADRNGNSKIDPEEENEWKLDQPDYLKLNTDGSCEYSPVKIPARYVLETTDDGKIRLAIYDPTGPEVSTRYIMSVTEKELVVYRVVDSFEIFRRL
jgi:hypothetical protein